ncbi:MAG TPA: hypothetical protein PK675_03650 [Clostridia bacterium]|nr:hypothetical protein [Clostridia bacterium]
MKSKTQIPLVIIIIFCAVLFFINPKLYSGSFMKGLAVWSNSVLPSLFPFLFLSNLLVNSGCLDNLGKKNGLNQKLFNAPPQTTSVFVLSMLCGYPVGAKTIAEMYEKRSLSSSESCYKLTTLCSCASPIYAIGTVGINFLKSFKAGIILYVSLFLGQILCGLVFRKKFLSKNDSIALPADRKINFGESMYSAVTSILTVGGYIALFYMLCEMISNVLTVILPMNAVFGVTLSVIGLLEMTNGCYAFAGCFPLQLATILCSFALSFGGFCVFLQCLPYYEKCRLNGGKVLIIKLTQCFLTGLICLPLSLLL